MKKIHIFNMRLGLACNSSSSHSILMLKKGSKVPSTNEYSEFHWSHFTVADKESKNNYLKAAIVDALRDNLDESKHNEFLSKFFNEDTIGTQSSIDHQSVPLIPSNFKGGINEEFINDFQKFLLQDEVVIAGGNDNTDETHPLTQKNDEFFPKFPKEADSKNWIARKDEAQDFWLLFNKVTGSKLRFSFNSGIVPVKSTVPELVDIKITDYCPYDCEFCYQDSTLKGQHASIENIKEIARKLSEAQVLEVAIAGGEGTLHPQFLETLKTFNESGIVANFTTKNFNLLRSPQAPEILKHTGAIAFSVESSKDIEKVFSSVLDYPENEKFQESYDKRAIINVQYVMGTTSMKEFKDILLATGDSGFNITLLGYKENGRGSQFAAQDYSQWLDIVKEAQDEMALKAQYPNISIDTALAGQYHKELIDAGVESHTFHMSEGTFSMYIDAVNKTMSPSSYIGFEQTKEFDDNWIDSYVTMGIDASSEKPKRKIKIN